MCMSVSVSAYFTKVSKVPPWNARRVIFQWKLADVVKQLLRSLSIKQGRKYDNPHSVREIRGFVSFHQLDLTEVLLPLEEFTTYLLLLFSNNRSFNEFFYRKLKPGIRLCTAPDNPSIVVSPADCRCVVFSKIEKAAEIWIKGRGFMVQRLLSPAYSDEAAKFEGGALGIFRLAPQDYHRFHIPVDGVVGEPRLVEGQYYTVNPMAIRSTYGFAPEKLMLDWMFMARMYELLCLLILKNLGGLWLFALGR